jgi:Xaa-Pro aminopeptidase
VDKRQYLEKTLSEALADGGYDAVVAVSPENVQHLCGVFIASQRMIRDRLAFAVYRREGGPFMVVSTVVAYTARTHSWIDEVVTYKEHAVKPIDGLVGALKDHGLGSARVLIEMGALPARDADRLRQELPKLEIADAERILDRSRMVKAPSEIERMRGNALAWERAVFDGFKTARVNEAERSISQRMISNIHANGADWVPFTIFQSGEHTLMNHWVADASPVKLGDIIMVDMVGFFGGYYMDAARMAIFGKPSEAQKDAYRRTFEMQRQLLDFIRPGVRAKEVFAEGVRAAGGLGMTVESPDLGHSLGIRLHEYPIMSPHEDETLVENMVMCVEVAQKFEGLGRFHVEDVVLLTKNGPERLTSLMDTREMMMLG